MNGLKVVIMKEKSGHQVFWSPKCHVTKLSGHQVFWSPSCLVTKFSGHQVVWSPSCLFTKCGHQAWSSKYDHF